MQPQNGTGKPPGTRITPNIGALYLQYREKLIRKADSVLLHKFGLRDGGEEVVQQVFMELQERPPTERVANWEALLVNRTHLRAIDHGRKQHVDKRGPSVFSDEVDVVDPNSAQAYEDVERAMEIAEHMGDLHEAMSELNDKVRHVFVRLEQEDAGREQVAAELGVSPSRVSQIRKAALEKVRARIKKDVTS